jgi:FixJ family two-component response regulator
MALGRRKPVIAIIEDDTALREALEWLLSAAQYDVRAYESAEEFIAWRGQRPSCLVVDIQLPGATGLEMFRTLGDRGESVPAIFMTAFDSPARREGARAAGVYLKKPFDGVDLIEAIEAALRDSSVSR